jgi:hypothetical protein
MRRNASLLQKLYCAIRAGQPHDLMPHCLKLLGNVTTDVAGCSGEKNVHALFSPFVFISVAPVSRVMRDHLSMLEADQHACEKRSIYM